ncbi:SDR family oxidoreductase [Clostridium sp. NSJ-49]|uniref:SDR family oxidoreductase n=1 Tax=Clostridium TaxID=1485 RepID=UPI00164A526D|nr:SDR family oxidoreductase [Clostridium sp. NSJ-49]MBC5626956.1 SDR family oxidoreductase [Clostridium sp. NSJ-49]
MNFKDKVCVITGGANGIGRCIVEEFIKAGTKVAIIDTDKISGNNLIKKFGEENLFFYYGDITEENTLNDFVNKTIEKFKNIDYLINNACISRKGILSDCSFNDFNYVLKLGVTAPYMLSKLFLNYFNPKASIVNISSTRAYMSQADTESYTAAKGGISALTHGLSISLAGKVRVNSISPGWIDTGAYQHSENYKPQYSIGDTSQHPSGRVGEPLDIANMVLFLCSDKAGFITGENITIDGGMTKQMIYHDDCGWTYIK